MLPFTPVFRNEMTLRGRQDAKIQSLTRTSFVDPGLISGSQGRRLRQRGKKEQREKERERERQTDKDRQTEGITSTDALSAVTLSCRKQQTAATGVTEAILGVPCAVGQTLFQTTMNNYLWLAVSLSERMMCSLSSQYDDPRTVADSLAARCTLVLPRESKMECQWGTSILKMRTWWI